MKAKDRRARDRELSPPALERGERLRRRHNAVDDEDENSAIPAYRKGQDDADAPETKTNQAEGKMQT